MSKSDRPLHCPFTILVDTAEGAPFEFKDIKSDSNQGYRTFIVETERCCLGRYPNSFGDYSIKGFFGQIGIERKSIEDIQSTVLGWETKRESEQGSAGRRERFEEELRNLSQIEAGLVIIEGSLADVLSSMPQYGAKTREQNCKHFQRFLVRYYQDRSFYVPWVWCDTRRMAEVWAFRFLHRFWRKKEERKKEIEKQRKKMMKEAASNDQEH